MKNKIERRTLVKAMLLAPLASSLGLAGCDTMDSAMDDRY